MSLLSFIIPTRNRPKALAQTLRALGDLDTPADSAFSWRECEVIIIDNAGAAPITVPDALPNGMPVCSWRMRSNLGAAARNEAAHQARGEWLVMLDDDSAPDDGALLTLLPQVPDTIVGLCADIHVPTRGREAGGLPEVPVGCGFAVRREAFCEVGGYDPSYLFYAEEYDLAAKLIRRFADHPWPIIAHDPRFRVTHRKVRDVRSMDTILHRLVRNNAWTIQRYTPDEFLEWTLLHTLERYRAIAEKENAMGGYEAGRRELEETLADQPRAPLPAKLYDRFTGLAAARMHLQRAHKAAPFQSARIVHPGKNEWAVRQALAELGITITADDEHADVEVIGALSPGPMLDAFEAAAHRTTPVHLPWDPYTSVVDRKTDATLAA